MNATGSLSVCHLTDIQEPYSRGLQLLHHYGTHPQGKIVSESGGFFCFITQCIPLEDDGFGRLDNLGSEEEFIAEFEGVRKDYVSVQFTDIRQEKRRKSLG
jgi:hypothetical protein